jgi:hypothetical protein
MQSQFTKCIKLSAIRLATNKNMKQRFNDLLMLHYSCLQELVSNICIKGQLTRKDYDVLILLEVVLRFASIFIQDYVPV